MSDDRPFHPQLKIFDGALFDSVTGKTIETDRIEVCGPTPDVEIAMLEIPVVKGESDFAHIRVTWICFRACIQEIIIKATGYKDQTVGEGSFRKISQYLPMGARIAPTGIPMTALDSTKPNKTQ